MQASCYAGNRGSVGVHVTPVPGKWSGWSLPNDLQETRMETGAGFRYEFQVAGSAPDTEGPVLRNLSWSQSQVAEGDPVRIVAEARDSGSGVAP